GYWSEIDKMRRRRFVWNYAAPYFFFFDICVVQIKFFTHKLHLYVKTGISHREVIPLESHKIIIDTGAIGISETPTTPTYGPICDEMRLFCDTAISMPYLKDASVS